MNISMTSQKIIQYIVAGLFLLVLVTAFMPLITINIGGETQNLTIWQIRELGQSFEDAEALPFIGSFAGAANQIAIQRLVMFFSITGFISMAAAVVECVLTLILRGKWWILTSGLGVLVNATIKIIVTGRIHQISDYMNELAGLFGGGGQDLCYANTMSLTIWILIHVAIVGLIIWQVISGRKQDTRQSTFQKEQGLLIDEPFKKGREIVVEKAFYGAIVGLTGAYREKAYPMLMGERVYAGQNEAEELQFNESRSGAVCEISYDEEHQEYHVVPLAMRSVYLRSGQPLGENRIYCLPRGTEIMIGSVSNRFQLA